jgi:hypothetical protein
LIWMATGSGKGPFKRLKGWFHRRSSSVSHLVSPNSPPKQEEVAGDQDVRAPIVTSLSSDAGQLNAQIG